MPDLKDAMLLWIPHSWESDDEFELRAAQATEANGGVLDFCDGTITLDDMFQIVEANECDIDIYINNLSHLVELLG
jgi:hypothetical protein